MLANEARWIGQTLNKLESRELSPVLNVGSATAEFRKSVQPWIDTEIFAPLRNRGVHVEHTDIQQGGGVDLPGDFSDDTFVNQLMARQYRSVLCCNLLEHVEDREGIAAKLTGLVSPGGYLIVTVPRCFPYHPDPIDTMFRPDVAELSRLFPRCQVREGVVLDCGTGWDYVDRNPRVMISKLLRRLGTLKEHGGVSGSASFMPWLFRTFKQTCVLLQRVS